MSEIYNQDAYNEGVRKADEVATAINAMVAKAPKGFNVTVTGNQMQITAPHGIVYGPGRWNITRNTTYTNSIETLTEKEFNEILTLLQTKVAEIDRNSGFTEQMQRRFPSPQLQQEQKAEKPKEPELTLEQIHEKKIRDIENQISEEVKAVELAKTSNLTEQVTAHEDDLEYLKKACISA